jgi:predicted acyltransferase (DUF342 family)
MCNLSASFPYSEVESTIDIKEIPMKSLIKVGIPAVLAFVILGCRASINGGLSVEDGQKVNHDLLSINGSIWVGTECRIRGWCRSINGSIEIGDSSQITGLQSINGQLNLGRNVWIKSGLMSINGSIQCEPGCRIGNDIRTVNGSIQIDSTEVKGDISTHNGDIRLAGGSVVRGNVIIRHSKNENHRDRRPIQIDIDGRSLVEGNVEVRDPDVDVEVRLSNGGRLAGKAVGAKVIENPASGSGPGTQAKPDDWK